MRHPFFFNGGEELTTMGATWFVSYSWYDHIDKSHKNWRNVSTFNNRISVYRRTISYHSYWLNQIIKMKLCNLEKNTIGLKGSQIIEMANTLLKKISVSS